jgi:hypothetical protein
MPKLDWKLPGGSMDSTACRKPRMPTGSSSDVSSERSDVSLQTQTRGGEGGRVEV